MKKVYRGEPITANCQPCRAATLSMALSGADEQEIAEAIEITQRSESSSKTEICCKSKLPTWPVAESAADAAVAD
jgi:hypothetical protein